MDRILDRMDVEIERIMLTVNVHGGNEVRIDLVDPHFVVADALPPMLLPEDNNFVKFQTNLEGNGGVTDFFYRHALGPEVIDNQLRYFST